MKKVPWGKHAVEGGRLTIARQTRPTSRHRYLQSHSDRLDPSQARPQNVRQRRHPVYHRNRSGSLDRGVDEAKRTEVGRVVSRIHVAHDDERTNAAVDVSPEPI